MEHVDNFKMLRQYHKVADELIAHSRPEELAECARLLALNVAHYQAKYGAVQFEKLLAELKTDSLGEEQINLMSAGTQTLVGMLGFVLSEDSWGR